MQTPRAAPIDAEEPYLYIGPSERRSRSRGTPEGGPPRTALVTMILGTFSEMPGFSVHLPQAARLFGMRPDACRVVLDDLVAARRVRRLGDGRYTSA